MENLGIAYLFLSLAVGLVGAVAVWIAAISQSGIAIGATLGSVAAFFSFYIIAAVWPILALIYLWKRDVAQIWLEDLFERRRLLP